MSQVDTVGGGDQGDPTPDPAKVQAENEMQRKLTEANDRAAAATVYAQMMRDPDFAAVAQAKAAGSKIKVVKVDEEEAENTSEPPEPIDLDKLDNKGLVEHIVKRTVKEMTGVVKKQLQPFAEQINGLATNEVERANERSRSEIDSVRERYPDFDQHVKTMMTLSEQNPKLKPLQLYRLAKAEAGEEIIEKKQLQSERPSNVIGRPPSRETRKTPLPPGRLGFNQLVKEAAQKAANSGILRGYNGDAED